MTPAEAAQAINARFLSMWPSLSGDVPCAVDNVVRAEQETFARLAIISLEADQASLGPVGRRRWEHTGIIEVRLHGPINAGRKPLDLLAGYVRTIFRGVRFGYTAGQHGITTHGTAVSELRRDRDSPNRWILTASTPFEFTEIA